MIAPGVAPAAALPRGEAFVAALGGAANLQTVDACTTRLRLIVADQAAIDEAALTALGSRGVIRPSAKALQVVLGPIADAVAMEMNAAIGGASSPPAAVPSAGSNAEPLSLPTSTVAALGGAANIRSVTRLHGRVRVALMDPERSDAEQAGEGFRGAVLLADGIIHLLERPAPN